MPLEKQVVNFPFAVDIETKSDPKQLNNNEVPVIENARTDQNNQIRQRNGTTALTTTFFGGVYQTTGKRLLSRQSEIALDDTYTVNSYSVASGSRSTTWRQERTSYPWLSLSTKTYGSSSLGVVAFASNDNVECVYSQGLFQVYEKTNKTLLFSSFISTGQANIFDLAIACFTDVVWVVYSEFSSSKVRVIAFNLSTFNQTIAATDLFASSSSYIRLKTWRDNYVVVCEGTTLKTYAKTSATSVGSASLAFACMDVDVLLGAAIANDRLFAAYWDGSSKPTFRQYDYTGTATAAAVTLSATAYTTTVRYLVCGAVASNEMKFVFSGPSGTSTSIITSVESSYDISCTPVGTSAGNIAAITGHPYSKPFAFGGRVYIFMLQDGSGLVSLICSTKRVVNSFGEPYIYNPAVPTVFVYSDYFEFALSNKNDVSQVFVSTGTDNPGTNYIRYKFTDDYTNFGQSIEYGTSNYSPKSGCVQYDGASFRHVGFFSKPKIVKLTTAAGTIPAGTYQWVAVFMHKDNEGRLHRSQVSAPVSSTFGTAKNVSFEIVNPGFDTFLSGSVSVTIYRTQNGGTTFYQVGSYLWDESSAYTSWTDSLASIDSNAEILYTTSGELDSVACPVVDFITTHQNRFFAISAENRNRILYTKEIDVNTSPEWNEDLFLDVNDGYGGGIGLASIDEKLIVFKEREIFYFLGEGPSPSGENATYSLPIRLTSDIGLSEKTAICVMPLGVIFKSLRGWLLLDRNMQLVQIGDPVQRFNSTSCRASVVNKPEQTIHFFLSDGNILVFNYNQMRWSVDTNAQVRSATLWNQALTYLDDTDGLVRYYTSSKILDGSTYTSMKVTSPWIPLAGAQGFQRIYEAIIFGEFRAAHTLRVRIGYNYDPVFKEEKTITANSSTFGTALTNASYYSSTLSAGGEPSKIYQVKVKPYIQKCEAIRFEITILNPSLNDSELCRLAGLALTFGLKPKTYRMNSGRTMTT